MDKTLKICHWSVVDSHLMNQQGVLKTSYRNLKIYLQMCNRFIISKSTQIYLDKCHTFPKEKEATRERGRYSSHMVESWAQTEPIQMQQQLLKVQLISLNHILSMKDHHWISMRSKNIISNLPDYHQPINHQRVHRKTKLVSMDTLNLFRPPTLRIRTIPVSLSIRSHNIPLDLSQLVKKENNMPNKFTSSQPLPLHHIYIVFETLWLHLKTRADRVVWLHFRMLEQCTRIILVVLVILSSLFLRSTVANFSHLGPCHIRCLRMSTLQSTRLPHSGTAIWEMFILTLKSHKIGETINHLEKENHTSKLLEIAQLPAW